MPNQVDGALVHALSGNELSRVRTELVWSKNSNGLRWRSLGFCTDSLLKWASPVQKQRLQSRFHEGMD
jgi:hypothetical protein